jgi:hypothetical protein
METRRILFARRGKRVDLEHTHGGHFELHYYAEHLFDHILWVFTPLLLQYIMGPETIYLQGAQSFHMRVAPIQASVLM